MLFQDNNLNLKQTLPFSSLSPPQTVQKKNLYQIEPLETPFNPNFIPKTNTLIQQNSEKKEETKKIEENLEEKNNNEIKKPKEIKVKKKKFKKFKIYHIEFKKLSEKDKILNKQRHKRKYKPDDIRKKIKARFHKSIKNIINDNLRKAGSKKLFTYLPQVFISSITKEKNRNVLDLSFREILQKDFVSG